MARVLSIGTATPMHARTQEEMLALQMELMPEGGLSTERVRRVYERSGVATRGAVLFECGADGTVGQKVYGPGRVPSTGERMRLYAEHAPGLAHTAGARAIEGAGIEPGAVTHLITASCTGFSAPGVDQALGDLLGLDRGVERTHLGFMGCHAAVNGLALARMICRGDADAIVLVCCIELCSLHMQFGGAWSDVVANALFADGAAAAVVVGASTERERSGFRVVDSATQRIAGSEDEMGWTIGDRGFEMFLSPRVPDRIGEAVPGWVDGWLGGRGLGRDDIRCWAVHPGGPRVLELVTGSLEIDAARARWSGEVLREHGNMSSATVLFVLDRARADLRKGDLCVALAFGPGLVAEGLLLEAV